MFRGMSTSPDEKDVRAANFEKIGPNTHKTSLDGLKQGEYLVYGHFGLRGGPMGSLGKMYTFGVVK